LQVYDDFGKAGYSLTDDNEKWMTPNGLGEMAAKDTRSFSGGCLHVSAVPFQTGSDVGVDDHRKYLAVSTRAFPVPPDGTLVLPADVKASTPGTVPGLTQLGVYGPSGSWVDPAKPPALPQYTARRLQGQQAGVVMNVLDFCTGQVFDWFIASDTAFALIERLPAVVTGNVGNPDCGAAAEVGLSTMYTQIIREVPVPAEQWHHLDIALTRHHAEAWAGYFLDHQLIAHAEKTGIPLDNQGVPFTGIYTSAGGGELVAGQLDSVRFGHGLFSLDTRGGRLRPRRSRPRTAVRAGRRRIFRQLHDVDDHRAGRQVRHRQRARRGAQLARPAPAVSAPRRARLPAKTPSSRETMWRL